MTLAGTTVSETGDVRVQSLTQGITMTPSAHTAIRADGNLNLSSGRDLTATAADVTAGGTLAVDAGRDINLLDGHETGYARDELYVKYKSGWATVRKHRIDTEESDQSRASTFTGDSVQMKAGRDILVRGSNVGAQNDLTLAAERDLTIVAGENTAVEDHYRKEKRTGWGATGGLSNGMRQITTTLEGVGVTYTPSVVGSVDGNVGMQAEGSVAVKGSQVLANKGNIDITGRDIDVAPVIARDREKHFHEFKEGGFRISVGVPLVNAIEKIERMAEASSQVDNPIMKAIAAGAMGGIVANTVAEAVVNEGSAESPASMTITLDYGAIRTASTVNRNSTDVVGSTMQAGQDLTLTAKGAGQDSNITVTGSTLSAGGKVMLDAEGDLKLQAAASTAEQRTDHSHFDGKIGVGVMLGASGGAVGYGFVVKGSIAASQGWTEGMRTEWVNTHVKGKDVFMRSGGDTLMRGAQVRGKRIDSNIRGNLLMESPQDEHTYNAEDMSANAGFTLCYGYCTSSGYASAGYGQMNSLYKSVREQTGMWAGEDGFDIYVGKNTKLKGAVIAGDDRAVAAGVNRLNTGTLEMEDIKNVAKYDAFQVSAGMGGGAGGKGAGGGGGGVGMTMPGGALAFDQARSTTYSAISGGHLTIRDLEGQVALTGDTVEEMLASVDRDTSNTNHVLKPIFDREKVQAGLDIVTEATKQAGAFLANKAKEADAIKTELDKTPEGPKRDALLARYAEAAKWGNGGTYRRALTAVLAAASGNVAAGAGQFVLSATVNYLQALGAETIKELAKHIGGEGSPAHIALHSILACSGAAAQGANCGAGALGASSSIVLGQLISKATEKKAENLTAAEREQRTQLIVDLVTGIGSALDARTAPTAITAARTELENNSMVMPPLQSGVAGGALGAVGTSGNKRVLNNQERQMELLGQGTADQGTTTSSISWGLDGIYEWLFGAPAEPVPPTGPLVNPAAQDADVGTPGRPGQLLEPVLLPGQANEGPHEGLTTSMPLPEPSGPILILQEAEATGSGSITIDEARARHIFRDAEGHISDTPINRRLLENIANDPSAVLGTDKYGTTWAARLNPDGTQTWVGIRGGKVSYGGINHTQKSFHSETGLASPTRPGRER
jgi:filamentous hemagglutinin